MYNTWAGCFLLFCFFFCFADKHFHASSPRRTTHSHLCFCVERNASHVGNKVLLFDGHQLLLRCPLLQPATTPSHKQACTEVTIGHYILCSELRPSKTEDSRQPQPPKCAHLLV